MSAPTRKGNVSVAMTLASTEYSVTIPEFANQWEMTMVDVSTGTVGKYRWLLGFNQGTSSTPDKTIEPGFGYTVKLRDGVVMSGGEKFYFQCATANQIMQVEWWF